MAGSYPYYKFDKSDWSRIAGRKFKNRLTGDVISRRQFDEHYGQVKFFGTYEKKAKAKAAEENALLRPARGRKSALKLADAEKQVELNNRKVSAKETKADKLIAKLSSRKIRPPHSFTLKNFRRGSKTKKFAVPANQQQIEYIRLAAAKSKIIISYNMGLHMVSPIDGTIRTPTVFQGRHIDEPFTETDFQDLIKKWVNGSGVSSSGFALVGMWMLVTLKRVAGERNGAKYPHVSHMRRK